MSTPPCAGQHELFDSLDPADHIEARVLCRTCPLIEGCRALLKETTRTAYSAAYGPAGTWAGELVGRHLLSRRAQLAEEAMFDEAAGRKAHAAWVSGDRGPMVAVGERVYQRRKKRHVRARSEAA